MTITKVGPKYQVTIPKAAREAAGIKIGDFVEATVGRHGVTFRPKALVDTGEVLTPRQRAVIDARLAKSEADIKAGRVSGPFVTVDELKRHLNRRG